jgi:hypothetical protein
MDFSKFDEQVDLNKLQKDAEEAAKNGMGEYPEIEDGTYTGKFEKLELGETKDGRPMFKAMFRITEGEHKKSCLFMNRVIYGTKNDANMIASVSGFLYKLEAEDENGTPIDTSFHSYAQFADMILDVAEAIEDMGLEYEIEYKKDAFNNISIVEVFDAE